ncbi:AAA family ATPase [Paracoccus sp. FO-3]|uniref:AAA family ATPase n=1 Tax=Paracoccus sp. FO-3 TaxID=1335059 RepID=UPI002106847B|nr:AAA family ATPase [Paracoccus sp. FO-3]
MDLMDIIGISADDAARIRRRVKRILELRKAATGLEHLKSDDRARLDTVKNGARLISIPSERRADELAATLQDDMSWMAPATEVVWRAMRRSVREGWPGLRVPPLLLDGPPGIGKSHWARRFGELLSVPTAVIEATGENVSFGVVGSQRGWGGSCPGRLIETVLQSRVANPVMVVDEVEKAGTAVSMKGHAFRLAEALLPLLEPLIATRWSCPYYQVKFDMSWVMWVLTSNDHRRLPEPLLSRCPPIPLRPLTLAELQGFVRREGVKRALSETAVDAICEVLAHPTLQRHHPSLRVATRMLQRAADLEQRPVRH